MDSDYNQPGCSLEVLPVVSEDIMTFDQHTPVRHRLEGLKKSDLGSQTKSIIMNVLSYVRKLANPDFLKTVNFSKSQEVTAEICQVSLRSVQRCVQESKLSPPDKKLFLSPRKKYNREKTVSVLSDFDCDVARRTVLEFYDRGEFPSAEKVQMQLREKMNFKGSVRSTRRLLHNLGFKYKRANDGRKFLLERQDIVATRTRFLRKMHALRQEEQPRQRIYLDETWVNQSHTQQFIWQQSDKRGGLRVPTGKGGRLIVCHAGGINGFVPECKWVFRSKKNDTDYHSEMNHTSFKKWFCEELLLSLEEPSVILMDNAPYHSALLEKMPTTNWNKKDIQEWLTSKNITYIEQETRAELLEKIAPLKKEKKYELDELALSYGHEVVRLPPYHCQYNPIELIWAQVKREVAVNNKTFKIADVEKLTSEAIDHVTPNDWKKCFYHAEKLQTDDWARDIVRDDTMEPFIINLNDDDSTDSDSEMSG